MSSNHDPEPLDLERGLPTTAEDVAALKRLRYRCVSTEDYLRFLRSLAPPTTEELRRKPGPKGPPFRL